MGELVPQSVEQTINTLPNEEADQLTNKKRYERTEVRRDTRAGYYTRRLSTKAEEVTLKVLKPGHLTFGQLLSNVTEGAKMVSIRKGFSTRDPDLYAVSKGTPEENQE